MDKPLLSICIPTYNRSDCLEKCLEALVKQECFDNRIEIIISDNCSTDNTQIIGERYKKQFCNIHYYRNEENLIDGNFSLAFSRASGYLRKLTNDTIIYRPGALKYMLTAVENNLKNRPQIFFLNSGENKYPMVINDLESYVGNLGFRLTWIASIALWDDDCDDLSILAENAYTRLGQVPFLLSNFEKRGKAVVLDEVIMDSLSPDKKDLSYGLYNVFYTTFLGFLKQYLSDGKITEACYEKVRKDLLFKFFFGWILEWENNSDQYIFSDEDLKGLIWEAYHNEKYYSDYKRKRRIHIVKSKLRKGLLG